MLDSGSAKCVCEICKNNKDFDLPKQLLEAFRSGDVVIFAGAGVSTEGKTILPYTFYDEIAGDVGIEAKDGPTFPAVAKKMVGK